MLTLFGLHLAGPSMEAATMAKSAHSISYDIEEGGP